MRFLILNGIAIKVDDISTITIGYDHYLSNENLNVYNIKFRFEPGSDCAVRLSNNGSSLIIQMKYNGKLPDDFETDKFLINRVISAMDHEGIFDFEEILHHIKKELQEAVDITKNLANN